MGQSRARPRHTSARHARYLGAVGRCSDLAFDFIGNDGIASNNTVVVSDFYTSGTLGNSSSLGGVLAIHPSPPGPFPIALTDTLFFNEFLQELTLGATVSFTLNLTGQWASGSLLPDSFQQRRDLDRDAGSGRAAVVHHVAIRRGHPRLGGWAADDLGSPRCR